jgi:hypothetical protein
VLLLGALSVAALVPGSARAAYPGRNGLIAYQNAPDRFGDVDELDAVLPRGRVPLALVVCPTPGTLGVVVHSGRRRR